MRRFATPFFALLLTATACARQSPTTTPVAATAQNPIGFDRDDYPGDAALPALRRHFAFAGYWLTNPPGERHNTWIGKRDVLLRNGFGFLVLANGKTDAEITRAKRTGTTPAALGAKDAAAAVAAAQREHFSPNTIIFLDQEEGGRLNANQSSYLLAWTEAVAHTGYRPGVYASGPPDVTAWQYAQSPRRKEITAACGKTYAADGNCYAPGVPSVHLDLSVASSSDPSHGR
jgi:hypothetical protein